MTGSDVTGRGHFQKYVLRMRNRKLRNIRRNRAFSPTGNCAKDVTHVTGSDVTGRGHFQKYVLRMRNRKLRNIRRNSAFSPENTSLT